jgi:hypothetical protein
MPENARPQKRPPVAALNRNQNGESDLLGRDLEPSAKRCGESSRACGNPEDASAGKKPARKVLEHIRTDMLARRVRSPRSGSRAVR